MIFVTVGTHEQPFNRLIEEVDRLKAAGVIGEDVLMQIGYSTYEPKYCEWERMLSYQTMEKHIKNAKMIIAHGGPASFLAPLQMGKTPIVVPRQKQYGEHVNDHQVDFCRMVKKRLGNIIVVEEIEKLHSVVKNYEEYCIGQKSRLESHNQIFSNQFKEIVRGLYKEGRQ